MTTAPRDTTPTSPGPSPLGQIKVSEILRREESVAVGWTDPTGSRLPAALCFSATTPMTGGCINLDVPPPA